MPAFDRIDRISQEAPEGHRRHSSATDLRDPRIGGTWSIVRCEVTRDLRYCKVARVDPRTGAPQGHDGRAAPRGRLCAPRSSGGASTCAMCPKVLFELDTNIEYAARINQILKETESHDAPGDD